MVRVYPYHVEHLLVTIADDARTAPESPRQEADVGCDVAGDRGDDPVLRDGFGPHALLRRLRDLPPGQLA